MQKVTKVTISNGKIESLTLQATIECDFEIFGAKFRIYNNALWIDGGEHDDDLLRNLETSDIDDYATTFDLTITAAEVQEARNYVEYLAEPTE